MWTEVRNFQKCLIQTFMASGQEVLFLETAMQLTGGRSHAVMECIPVPSEALSKVGGWLGAACHGGACGGT